MKNIFLIVFCILLISCNSDSIVTKTDKDQQIPPSTPIILTPSPTITKLSTSTPTPPPSLTITLTPTPSPSHTSTITITPTETEILVFLKDVWSEKEYLAWMAHVGSWAISYSEYFRHEYPGIPYLEYNSVLDLPASDAIYWEWFYKFYETVTPDLACKWAYEFITTADGKILEEKLEMEKERLKLQFLRYSGDPEKVTYCEIFENLK